MQKLSLKATVWLWILATVITLASAVYQRMTGPTHPVRGRVTVDQSVIKFKLLRTHDSDADAIIEVTAVDPAVSGEFRYRRYKSNDQWTTVPMNRMGNVLLAEIPRQPPAGKVMYDIYLTGKSGSRVPLTAESVVMRFKGPVPFYVLHPHIFFMFFAMLLGTRAGLEALANGARMKRFAIETLIFLAIGGLILGPIMQWYAFGALWTGWPFGHDLTDNKTAVAILFWAIALWRQRKAGQARGWYLAASLVQLLIYLIPHSALGSEIDYTKTEM
jgi:hypothetical protein